MSVFAHNPFYNNYGNFGGLVRFIDDWDKHFSQHGRNQRQVGRHGAHGRGTVATFTPRFDLRETEKDYQLHGELPGIEKKDVTIEFTDSQTIVIRGSVQRSYSEGTAPAGFFENAPTSESIADKPHDEDDQSHQATVEDDYEDVEPGTSGGHEAPQESENPPEGSSSKNEGAGEGEDSKKKAKYWIYERSIGNFSRSFTFASRVDQDNVNATLENGILTVVVPKAKKPESRRITVQ